MENSYRIDQNDMGVYPLGAVKTERGVHCSFVHPGEACAVLLYRPGESQPAARIDFPVQNHLLRSCCTVLRI